MSYGESILYFMQKYTYIKILGVFWTLHYFFQTDIVHFHFELKKKLMTTIRKNGLIALLQIILYMMH